MLFTISPLNGNLCLPLPHAMVGYGSLNVPGVSAPVYALFLCLSFMVGVLESFRACRFQDSVYQSNTFASRSLVAFGGDFENHFPGGLS